MVKAFTLILSLGMASLGFANVSPVTISSPADGAKLVMTAKNEIKFDVAPTPNADHVHVYVDNKDPIIVRKLKGNVALEKLSAGAHDICVKVADKNHAILAGSEKCIKVNVQ